MVIVIYVDVECRRYSYVSHDCISVCISKANMKQEATSTRRNGKSVDSIDVGGTVPF